MSKNLLETCVTGSRSYRLILFFWMASALLMSSAAESVTLTVNEFAPYSATPSEGVWYEMKVEAGGASSTVDLSGLGGPLENNQPLPTGAALLTTGSNNADVAHVGVVDAYGKAASILTDASLQIEYSFYKGLAGDLNAYAAPAIRLTLNNPTALGDGYGSLVYEPYWQPNPMVTVPTDEWISQIITSTSGLFWWDGGFGQPNSFGGPPLRTLADWAVTFDGDFTDADLLALSVGVGSYNQGQTGYFDDVSLSYTGYDKRYNFEAIPEPSTALLVSLGVTLLGIWRKP
ncbi:MAG: hypothetical protein CL917_17275 [Deltaproteobacteria bacterium]|nr:hypothetical protein [Deltaproteobacteria bacterium]